MRLGFFLRQLLWLGVGLLGWGGAEGLGAEVVAGWRAGMGRRDITPEEAVPLWGYGARHDFLSTGVRDRLQATALVLELGTNRLAIVGLDLGRSPSERSLGRIREQLRVRCGVQHSFIAGSHTHHGPVLELSDEPGKGRGRFDAALRYYTQLEDRIVEAVGEAAGRLEPVRLGVGTVVVAGLNRNRHTKLEPKPVDRELSVLRIDAVSGVPRGVLVNFGAHPTMVNAGDLSFSADYVGVMRTNLEAGLRVPVVFMQGASGDLSTSDPTGRGAEGYGVALAERVRTVFDGIETRESEKPSLVVREERLRFGSRVDLQNPFTRAAYGVAFFPELVVNYADEYADGVRPRLTVALLDRQVALVGVSGEMFCSHAIRLKERARRKAVMVFGCCNGYHQYFPTIEAVAEGGYGADRTVAPAEVGAGERIMETALRWIYELSGEIR